MMNSDHFARKVPSYFDGTLTELEKMELEAFVGSNPEFADYFKAKESEFNNLKNNIPRFQMEASVNDILQSELKEVIGDLFHDESTSVIEKFSLWIKEKL